MSQNTLVSDSSGGSDISGGYGRAPTARTHFMWQWMTVANKDFVSL